MQTNYVLYLITLFFFVKLQAMYFINKLLCFILFLLVFFSQQNNEFTNKQHLLFDTTFSQRQQFHHPNARVEQQDSVQEFVGYL